MVIFCVTNKVKIEKKTLERLYWTEKLSTVQIAKRLGCGKTTVDNRLHIYNLRVRNHSEAGKLVERKEKYKIPSEELKKLYHIKKLSMQQIADKYGIHDSSTIWNKFRKYKIDSRTVQDGIKLAIPRRSRSIAKSSIKYPKKIFSGDLLEKSYLFGFSAGDLHITKRRYGATIRMTTTTTKKFQVELVKSLFEKYTSVRISQSKSGQYSISCNLDLTFDFLLDYKSDKIPWWAIAHFENFLAFLGGYIDAEGHFGTDNSIGVFALSSYDKNILFQIARMLKKSGISLEGPRLTVKKGHVDKRGVIWKGDLWMIRIRKMRELYQFISFIKPYVKHKKRHNDLISVEKNLLSRTKRINLHEKNIPYNTSILPQ